MGSFQVCDALSIFFELEKPFIEHVEGSSFCREKVASCKIFPELLTGNSSLRKLEIIPPLDQQKLVHRWWEECLW
jgi:hypothetical protein